MCCQWMWVLIGHGEGSDWRKRDREDSKYAWVISHMTLLVKRMTVFVQKKFLRDEDTRSMMVEFILAPILNIVCTEPIFCMVVAWTQHARYARSQGNTIFFFCKKAKPKFSSWTKAPLILLRLPFVCAYISKGDKSFLHSAGLPTLTSWLH